MIEVAVQAQPRDSASWLALASTVERLGFSALLAADHPGRRASPFVALAAAAAVTSRIALGSYVSNAGIREPLLLASDVATLDLLSAGRARLGLGAGHAPAEWTGVGRVRPPVAERVAGASRSPKRCGRYWRATTSRLPATCSAPRRT